MQFVANDGNKPISTGTGRDNSCRVATVEELLHREARDSQRRAVQTIKKMKAGLRAGLRPAVITRSHPWASTGSAAVAGFAAGSWLASRIRKPRAQTPPTPATPSVSAGSAAASGAAAVGLAALVRAIASPAVPAILRAVYDFWHTQSRTNAPGASPGHRRPGKPHRAPSDS